MDYEKRFRVRPKGFELAGHDCADTAGADEKKSAARRKRDLERLEDLQERLYAEGRRSLLVVFQAMDAAGKDGTIAHVMSGLNPQGVGVTSFKQPTHTELAHDWLWRCQVALPARGEIGIFNRSHYEEVVAVRVHPEFLAGQAIDPGAGRQGRVLEAALRGHRGLGAAPGAQRDAGREVLPARVAQGAARAHSSRARDDPDKQWKFSPGDVAERVHWDAYQDAFEAALRATSTKEAPWYVIPADHKWFMRTAVAAILVHHLEAMDPDFPKLSKADRSAMREAVAALEAE